MLKVAQILSSDRLLIKVLAFALPSVPACGPVPATTTSDTSVATTSSTKASTTSSSTSSTSSSTSSTSSSTSSSTTGSSTTTGAIDPPVCQPAPESVQGSFVIDGGRDFGWRSFGSFKLCTVASVLQVENEITVSLSGCTSDPEIPGEEPELHVIEVTVDPAEPIDLAAGESVRFSLYIDVPWWTNKAFALHRLDDTLVLAGSSGNLVPGMSEEYAPADFAAPFSVQGIGDVCPPPERPPPPEPDCSFLECGGGCDPVAQREALAFSIMDGPTLQLMDHAASVFPGEPYSIVVSQAVQLHFLEMCADTASTWSVFVIVRH